MIIMDKDLQMPLPTRIPLLPLHGGLLLPRAQLPIPVLEIEYLSMITESLKSNQVIGVVQPILKDIDAEDNIPLFKTGCAGRITDISEMSENNLVVTLTGICRFEIQEEFPHENNYRTATVSYEKYLLDMVQEVDFAFDRSRLLKALDVYFKALGVKPNWKEISRTSNEKLITALAMVCPFEANEKQALLESPTLKEQSQIITTMIEIAALENVDQAPIYH